MASDTHVARFLNRLLSFSASDVSTRVKLSYLNWVEFEDENIITYSIVLCVGLGVSVILAVVFEVVSSLSSSTLTRLTRGPLRMQCRYATVRACSWVYKRSPWSRASELARRERSVELREASVARRAQTLALDVEIGVCKRLLETLRHSVTAAEDRASELQKEELLLQEILREESQGTGQILPDVFFEKRLNSLGLP
ncbi:hypothetical protein F5880DRAFT_1619553 [Lentinula raphanica]|nr:hypothetical protein F5880DRAFT_1619553 [Lentinula raphanica]